MFYILDFYEKIAVANLYYPNLFSYQISYRTTNPKDFCDVLENANTLTVLESDFYGAGKKIRKGNSLLLNAQFQ